MVRFTWVMGAALALQGASCGGGGDEVRAPLPHVLVLSIDTLRADRIGCYGGPLVQGSHPTPALDGFCEGARRFTSCTASSSWTLPSHASMFTGLYPFEHGTHGFRVEEPADNAYPLAPVHSTLAEEFQVVGYKTAGFAANTVYLSPRYGLAQGFDTYEVKRQPASAMVDRTLRYFDETAVPSGQPHFVFVNFMDMHRPYAAYSEEETLRLPLHEHPDRVLEQLCVQVMAEGLPPGELGERVLELYDTALTRFDAELGRLMEGLRARGLFEGTVILLTSDHGEAFGEHGIVEHAKDVFEPLVAVPLVLKSANAAPGTVDSTLASSVDVPGLIAREIPGPAGQELARSFPRTPGSHPLVSEIHFARPRELALYPEQFQHERTAWRDGEYKLIAGGKETQLFHLGEDPGELVNLVQSEPQRARTMEIALSRFLSAGAYAGERLLPVPATPREMREHAALGYSGGESEDGGNPKDD